MLYSPFQSRPARSHALCRNAPCRSADHRRGAHREGAQSWKTTYSPYQHSRKATATAIERPADLALRPKRCSATQKRELIGKVQCEKPVGAVQTARIITRGVFIGFLQFMLRATIRACAHEIFFPSKFPFREIRGMSDTMSSSYYYDYVSVRLMSGNVS